MHNKFKPYNKSLLVNMFMSNEYRYIYVYQAIPKYDEINMRNNWGWTSLILACFNGRINRVRLLLSHPNISINIKDNYGKNALDYAKERNYKQIINLLKQHNEANN